MKRLAVKDNQIALKVISSDLDAATWVNKGYTIMEVEDAVATRLISQAVVTLKHKSEVEALYLKTIKQAKDKK